MEWCTSAACPAKRRQVALTANTFVDPLSNEKITISQRETFLVTGDVRQLQSNSQKSYKYLINLGNNIDFSLYNGNHKGTVLMLILIRFPFGKVYE